MITHFQNQEKIFFLWHIALRTLMTLCNDRKYFTH